MDEEQRNLTMLSRLFKGKQGLISPVNISLLCVRLLFFYKQYQGVILWKILKHASLFFRDHVLFFHKIMFFFSHLLERLAYRLYENMRREAASINIQKNLRRHLSRKSYAQVLFSALTLQTGLRAMAARNEFRVRKQARAAKTVQVIIFHACIA